MENVQLKGHQVSSQTLPTFLCTIHHQVNKNCSKRSSIHGLLPITPGFSFLLKLCCWIFHMFGRRETQGSVRKWSHAWYGLLLLNWEMHQCPLCPMIKQYFNHTAVAHSGEVKPSTCMRDKRLVAAGSCVRHLNDQKAPDKSRLVDTVQTN